MSKTLNRVQLIGRLGQDPQTRYKTEIVASDMLILDSRGGTYNEGPSLAEEPVEIIAPARRSAPAAPSQSRPDTRTQQPKPATARNRPAVIEIDDDPEDLPF